MITAAAFAGKRYAVYGLARSGLATAQALLASGAEVLAWDEKEEARAALLSSLSRSHGEGDRRKDVGRVGGSGIPPHHAAHGPPPHAAARHREDGLTLADPLTTDLTGLAGVVVSPGVPINRHPIAAKALEAGVPLIGDIELFAQARPELPPHKVVGITGTNGKSTTTALVHHILKTAGVPTLMGGNIGLPILAQDPLPEGGVYVLELSSYQIDLTQSLDCDVAVLLNITPDHLDRYGSFDAYAASKARLFAMQGGGTAIVGTDDETTRATTLSLEGEGWVRVSDVRDYHQTPSPLTPTLSPLGKRGALVTVSTSETGDQSGWPALQGPHNAQNVAAARAVARALGIAEEAVEQGLRTYRGLPHRMELVAERSGVRFVNDSKATNPEAAAPALAAFPAVHWIVGGQAKTNDLGPCAEHLDHVRGAYTIGEAGPLFAQLLEGRVPTVTSCETLVNAVRAAAGEARAGEVVLLSPACASFDQFRDFEARGDAFRAAVEGLA